MAGLFDGVIHVLGIGQGWAELGPVQLSARAAALYLAALLVVRLGNERLLGKRVAFDVLLGFILGSLLCRAVVADDTLFHTVVAAGVMLAVHGMVAVLSRRRPSPPSAPTEPVRALTVVSPQGSTTRVLDVQVAEGVQTVRILLGD